MSPKDFARWVLYVGMAVCMVGGATWPEPRWLVVVAGIAVLAVGIAIKRQADRAAPKGSEDGGDAAGSFASAVRAMPTLLAGVRALRDSAPNSTLPDLAEAVEKLQRDGVDVIASAQDDFVRLHSFVAYAAVMAPLATGERMLHRAWSAASDGHRTETLASIQAAVPHIEAASAALEAVHPSVSAAAPLRT